MDDKIFLMGIKMRLLLTAAMMVVLTGCASWSYSPNYEKLGALDISGTSEINRKANEMKWADAEDISVFLGNGAEGMSVSENGALNYSEEQWEMLGKVSVSPDSYLNPFTQSFKPYPEDEGWRNGYCKVNGVMVIATLSIWGVLPFNWPCMRQETNSVDAVEARKIRIVNTLKKATKAAGGDTVIITSLGSIEMRTKAGQVVSTTEMTSAEGYAFRRKQ